MAEKHTPPITRRTALQLAGAGGIAWLLAACEGQPTQPTASTTPPYQSPSSLPSTTEVSSRPTSSASETTTQTSLIIPAALPKRIMIPSIGLDAGCDVAIRPEKVPTRRQDRLYYHPPTFDKISWADGCALPALPSDGTTYFFGHSDTGHRLKGGAVFDKLPRVKQGDAITHTTELGRFVYEVIQNDPIPFDELASHTGSGDIGDGSVMNRIVLITCRIADEQLDYGYNSVVVAQLASAALL